MQVAILTVWDPDGMKWLKKLFLQGIRDVQNPIGK